MKIEVQHVKRDGAGFEPVARITIPDDVAKAETFEPALEYAWRWTNNIDGSWSRGELLGKDVDHLFPNTDFNPNTEVLKPLRYSEGNVYGHRSSMVGDRFIIDDGNCKRVFEVKAFGFERVAP